MRLLALLLIAVAALSVTSCQDNTVGPTPHYPLTLSVVATSSLTATIQWSGDAAGVALSNRYVLLRGLVGGVLTDTVYNDTTSSLTITVVDSNHGSLLLPFTGYRYAVVRVKNGSTYDTSATVAATTLQVATLSNEKLTPISATMHIAIDSVAWAHANAVVLLRGTSAADLRDTVYSGAAVSSVLDSNKGKWLTGGSGFYYRAVVMKNTTVIGMSDAATVILPAGEPFPLVMGSVWVYRGYVTDTLTGARKPGSDYRLVDSVMAQISFQGFSDVYEVQEVKTMGSISITDTLYFRIVNGDYWEWSRFGVYPDHKAWINFYRLGTGSGLYIVKDTLDTVDVGTMIKLNEIANATMYGAASVTMPAGMFSARSCVSNIFVHVTDLPGSTDIVSDTLRGGPTYFASGFGIVGKSRPSYLATVHGLFGASLPKQEGFVEEIIAFRVKY